MHSQHLNYTIATATHTVSSVGVVGGLPSVANAGTLVSPGSSAPSPLLFRLRTLPLLPDRLSFFDCSVCSDGKGSTSREAILMRTNSGGRGECEALRAAGAEVSILGMERSERAKHVKAIGDWLRGLRGSTSSLVGN